MNITVEHPRPRVVVVHVQGRVDAVSAPELRQVLREQPERGYPWVIVDLQQVPFMDSSGLSALVSGLKAARQHQGMVYLVAPTPQVRMALQLSMLDRIFPIHPSVDDALKQVGEGQQGHSQ